MNTVCLACAFGETSPSGTRHSRHGPPTVRHSDGIGETSDLRQFEPARRGGGGHGKRIPASNRFLKRLAGITGGSFTEGFPEVSPQLFLRSAGRSRALRPGVST